MPSRVISNSPQKPTPTWACMLKNVTQNNNKCQEVFSNLSKKFCNQHVTVEMIGIALEYFNSDFLKRIKKVFTLIKASKEQIEKLDSIRSGRARNTYIISKLAPYSKLKDNKQNKNYGIARGLLKSIVKDFRTLAGCDKSGITMYSSSIMRLDFKVIGNKYTIKYKPYSKMSLYRQRDILLQKKDPHYAKMIMNAIVFDKHGEKVKINRSDIKHEIETKIDQCSEQIETIKLTCKMESRFEGTKDTRETYPDKYHAIDGLFKKRESYIEFKREFILYKLDWYLYRISNIIPKGRNKWELSSPYLRILKPKITTLMKLHRNESLGRLSKGTELSNNTFYSDKSNKNYNAVVKFNDTHNILEALRIAGVSAEIKKGDMIHCPFHDDSRPSFHLYNDMKMGNCFACGTQVKSPFNAIEKILNNKSRALELIKDSSINYDEKPVIKYSDTSQKKKGPLSKEVLESNDKKQVEYCNNLETDIMAQNYLYEIRNLTEDAVLKFKLGSSKTKDDLLSIKIPHITLEGDVIGIISNIPEGEPKYINSSYEKSYRPFGEYQTKGKHESIIFTEGVFDCINAHACGLTNCVSSLGACIDPEKIVTYAKSRKCSRLVLGFDNDQAGDKSTNSIVEYFHIKKEKELELSILDLKECKDLDEYLNKYSEVPKEISMIAYIFKQTYKEIESKKYLSEYGFKAYNGRNLLINKFPFLKKLTKNEVFDIITNFNYYLKCVENEEKSISLRKRSIIWEETSYQDKEYQSPLQGSNILDYEIIRTKNEFYEFSYTTEHINKYIKLRTSTLNLLIGDTGVGKTTFATHLATLNSEKPYKQLFISLEMDCGEVFRKCHVFNEVYGTKKKKNITIIEERCGLDFILEAIKKYKEKDDEIKVVYIDHLHLINVTSDLKNLIPMDKIANDLLELARELKIAIIGICQLTRESTRMYSMPQLHDIKNSSNLENNASIILGIHNPYLNALRAARATSFNELPPEKRIKLKGKENCFVLANLKNRHDRLIDPIEYIKIEILNEEKNLVEQMALFLLEEEPWKQ